MLVRNPQLVPVHKNIPNVRVGSGAAHIDQGKLRPLLGAKRKRERLGLGSRVEDKNKTVLFRTQIPGFRKPSLRAG